jgi:hypothetical protein
MRPFLGRLVGIMRPALSHEVEKEELLLDLLSIFSMVLYFNFAREAVSRITSRPYNEGFKNELIEHITRFSLKGLEGKTQGSRQ